MKLPENFKDTSFKNQKRPCFMFFSERAAALFGYRTASVPTGKRARKKIRYTGIATDNDFKEYQWPDKHLVWQGNDSEIQFIGETKPSWNKQIIPPPKRASPPKAKK